MPEEAATPAAIFLSQVHQATADAQELIDIYMTTYELLGDYPDFPEESKVLTMKTIETLGTLKMMVSMLAEHQLGMDEKMHQLADDLQARIKKR